jgi:hypothetical protein
MTLGSWIRNLFAGRVTPTIRKARQPVRMTLEELESRWCPSTFTVLNTLDNGSTGSLRWAIGRANANPGADKIIFDSEVFSKPQTIVLAGNDLELSDTTGMTTITGPAKGVTISAAQQTNVFTVDPQASAGFTGLTIADGVSAFGARIFNRGTVKLTNCTIRGNSTVNNNGGGMYNTGAATLTNCTFSGNVAGLGAALFNTGTAKLTDCSLTKQLTPSGYGTVLNTGTLTLANCTISGNTQSFGGALYNKSGTAMLTDCTISDNAGAFGGGVFNRGTVQLTDCTISGNTTNGILRNFGAGLYNNGNATLTNCTISGNTNSRGYGGGVENHPNGVLSLTNCTISGNYAYMAGGGLDNSGQATLVNTIVAGNTGGVGGNPSDIGGGANVTGNHNLIGKGGAGGLQEANDNLIGIANPGLSALGSYGGPTQTLGLLPDSPAIGRGVAVAGVTTDQRGVARPLNSIDIGAFQNRGFTIAIVAGGSPQSAILNQAFANPLTVLVASPFGDPVVGGEVTYLAPGSGALAVLSGPTASIGSNGRASVTATANGIGGAYLVSAAARGTKAPANFSLTNASLTVTMNPANQTAYVGQQAVFMAAAAAIPGATVQWQVNNGNGFKNIAGATNTTLTLANVQLSDSGKKYRAVFTNTADAADTATTTAATLTVKSFTISPNKTIFQPDRSVALLVSTLNAQGQLISSFQGALTLALVSSTSGGSLQGTLTAPVVNGQANFDNLLFTKSGRYTVRATIGGFSMLLTFRIDTGGQV